MSKRKAIPQIAAGTMADIAFLLLIFFLVTTTMEADKGIQRNLPPLVDAPVKPIDKHNLLTIKVNRADYLLVNGELLSVDHLTERCRQFIDNHGVNPEWSDHPTKAVISLQNHVDANYDMYVLVQNEVTRAYNQLRKEYAQRTFQKGWAELSAEQMARTKKQYPLKISEADPYGI